VGIDLIDQAGELGGAADGLLADALLGGDALGGRVGADAGNLPTSQLRKFRS
jgi:hypothetical protein